MSESTAQSQTESIPPTKRRWQGWMILALIGGVILPLIAVSVELAFRLCSSLFFDPIPTITHLILLLTVPAANLGVILVYLREARWTRPVGFLVGASISTGIVYSLQFLPLSPVSIIGLMFLGIGVCGLSPFLGLACSITCNRRLREFPHTNEPDHSRMYWSGVAIAGVILVGFLARAVVTDIGLNMAASRDTDRSIRGVRLLRAVGDESVILRACYELPTSMVFNPFSAMNWDAGAQRTARSTYYRVTGRSVNSVPPPKLVGFRSERAADFEFDPDVGGTAVEGRVVDVSLESSRLDAVIEPDSLVAYTEWTMVFSSSSSMQREARAEIALPPGGVVSRLTLWVNGEEREAAFSSRGKVRQAYQEIAVVRRRDPVLVTTRGPDRVLMQCFPIPPGGTMKIRMGITSPLHPESYSQATYTLPRFVERNFGIGEETRHSLLIESPGDMVSEGGSPSRYIRRAIPDSELSANQAILCSRDAEVHTVWCPDPTDPEKSAIVQHLTESTGGTPFSQDSAISSRPVVQHAVILIDGSRKLAGNLDEIADSLKHLPQSMGFTVLVAGDETAELCPAQTATPDTISLAAVKIRSVKCAGGVDNRPALLRACDKAIEQPNTAVVWVHGPQPLTSAAYSEQLLQLLERRPLRVYAVEAAAGRNDILAELEHTGAISVVPRRGSLASDLERLFTGWQADSEGRLAVVRSRVGIDEMPAVARTSRNLSKLWARDEVLRICGRGDTRKLGEAAELAAKHHIVTAVSGAVVLETDEQYEETGLEPVDPTKVQSVVPEPSSLIALAGGMMLVGGAYFRRRRTG